MTSCDRCGKTPLGTYTTSMFDTDTICMECKEDEKRLPSYAGACRDEALACKDGNYNYPGIGLTAGDRIALAQMRSDRLAVSALAALNAVPGFRAALRALSDKQHAALQDALESSRVWAAPESHALYLVDAPVDDAHPESAAVVGPPCYGPIEEAR